MVNERTWKNINTNASQILRGSNVSPVLFYLFLVHLFFLVFQLHQFTGLGFLGTIRLPGLVSLIACFAFLAFLPKVSRYLMVKLILFFLLFEGLRGVLGFTVLQDWVVNDRWQFNTWQLLLIYFFSLILPLITTCVNGKSLKILVHVFVFMGGLLGLWSVTHAGFGPGGYLHDENDHCLFLVSLLPFPFFLASVNKNVFLKILSVMAGLILLFGIVFTKSRGGYLGLFAVLGIFFLTSRRKGLWLGLALVLGLISLPFVPADFWDELQSIKTESKEGSGTIQERLDTWSIVTRMWLDSSNTLFGVGLENSKFNLGDYEDSAAGLYLKSLRGRSTHSFYFQILGDLGIYGVLIFLTLMINSLTNLRRVAKESRKLEVLVSTIMYRDTGRGKKNKKNESISASTYSLLTVLHKEIIYVRNLSATIFSSWFGLLAAALGISIAYYPPFWLYCALSLGMFIYIKKIQGLVLQIENAVKEETNALAYASSNHV